MFKNKKAWKEVLIDTAIAWMINFPLNMLLLYISKSLLLSITVTSILMSATFTVVAILRKYFIRIYFNNK